MKAYIKQIAIEDDDGEQIAIIKHDVDFMYKVELTNGAYLVPDEFRFIAKCLKMEILSKDLEV